MILRKLGFVRTRLNWTIMTNLLSLIFAGSSFKNEFYPQKTHGQKGKKIQEKLVLRRTWWGYIHTHLVGPVSHFKSYIPQSTFWKGNMGLKNMNFLIKSKALLFYNRIRLIELGRIYFEVFHIAYKIINIKIKSGISHIRISPDGYN